MKGIILAGGKGTRLWPLTEVTNKHLVPVGALPMIEYPLYTLNQLGVDSISIVTGGEHFQNIATYLAKTHPDINFSYHYQAEAGGIAQALSLTEPYVRGEKLAVILGDNVFEGNFAKVAREFENSVLGAMFFLKSVNDPERFAVAEIMGERIINSEEKPKKPKTNLAVTGLYFFDASVFKKIAFLSPSRRGELEITDVNNLYITEGETGFHMLSDFWSDAGIPESRMNCEAVVRNGLEQRVFKTISPCI